MQTESRILQVDVHRISKLVKGDCLTEYIRQSGDPPLHLAGMNRSGCKCVPVKSENESNVQVRMASRSKAAVVMSQWTGIEGGCSGSSSVAQQ